MLAALLSQNTDKHTEWLTGLYIRRRCKLSIIISPVVNCHDFRVSLGFDAFVVDGAAWKKLS